MMRFEVDPTAQPLRMPWKKGIAVGRAYELLREDLLSHLRKAQAEIGFNYCRFHGLFHDDMAVVHRKPDGTLVYQWHQVDKVLDALLRLGLKPFVELNPMPGALASGAQTMFFYKMMSPRPRITKNGRILSARLPPIARLAMASKKCALGTLRFGMSPISGDSGLEPRQNTLSCIELRRTV